MMRYPVMCERWAVLNLWIMALIFISLFILPVSAATYFYYPEGNGYVHTQNATNYTVSTPTFANNNAVRSYCEANYGSSGFNWASVYIYRCTGASNYVMNNTFALTCTGGSQAPGTVDQYPTVSYQFNASIYPYVGATLDCAYNSGAIIREELTDIHFRAALPSPPHADLSDFTCTNNCTIPTSISANDASTGSEINDWNWTFQWVGTSTSLYEEGVNIAFNTELPGYVVAQHCVANPGGSDCEGFSFTINNNQTSPAINITTNITAPNFTPVIPTLPLTIAPLPSQLNRSQVRGLINQSVYANVSEDYLAYWDDFYEGLYEMSTDMIDLILFPVAMVTEYLNTPNTWILQLATQYSERSNNIIPYMFAVVYAFPPKLLNLVTYSLCLDFVLVLMREFGSKK